MLKRVLAFDHHSRPSTHFIKPGSVRPRFPDRLHHISWLIRRDDPPKILLPDNHRKLRIVVHSPNDRFPGSEYIVHPARDADSGHPGNERRDRNVARIEKSLLVAARPVGKNRDVPQPIRFGCLLQPFLFGTEADEKKMNTVVDRAHPYCRFQQAFNSVNVPHVPCILEHELFFQAQLTQKRIPDRGIRSYLFNVGPISDCRYLSWRDLSTQFLSYQSIHIPTQDADGFHLLVQDIRQPVQDPNRQCLFWKHPGGNKGFRVNVLKEQDTFCPTHLASDRDKERQNRGIRGHKDHVVAAEH